MTTDAPGTTGTPEPTPPRARSGARGFAAPLVSALVVVALVVGVSFALSDDGGDDGPPPLRLAASGGDAASDERMAAPGTLGQAWQLRGTLPTGPRSAEVHELPSGAAPVQRVRELAQALGIDEAPERVVGAWRAGDLVVRDEPGHPWSYGAGTSAGCAPDSAVSSDSSDSSRGGGDCVLVDPVPADGSASGGGSSGSVGSGSATAEESTVGPAVDPARPAVDTPATTRPRAVPPQLSCIEGYQPAPPPNDYSSCVPVTPEPKPVDAVDPVEPVPAVGCATGAARGGCLLPPTITEQQALDATQRIRTALGLDDAEVVVSGEVVALEPKVAGLRTRGVATTLVLNPELRLAYGNGWLVGGRAGPSYPLVSATDAFERLGGAVDLGAPCDPQSGCPAPPTVTGAELGLLWTALEDAQAVLAPAWLFAVEGGGVVPVLALRQEDTVEPGAGEPGTGDPTEPSTEPGTAAPVPPPTGGRAPFGFDGAIRGTSEKQVVVRYGDSSSCPHVDVTGVAKEDPTTVHVLLEADAMAPDRVCTADYGARFVTVELQAPLGDRKVVDASTGREVAVVTCPSPTEMCPQ